MSLDLFDNSAIWRMSRDDSEITSRRNTLIVSSANESLISFGKEQPLSIATEQPPADIQEILYKYREIVGKDMVAQYIYLLIEQISENRGDISKVRAAN